MRRREFMTVFSSAAAVPLGARAEQRPLPLIAFLTPRTDEANVAAFRRGLHEFGYVEGQNITLETRSADGDIGRLPALAAELAALKPAVIVTNGELAIRALKNLAGGIPIVMSVIDNPVALGFAQSLAHPGGNLTGLTLQSNEVLGKRLQILSEAVPEPGCIAVLGFAGVNYDPNADTPAAAKALGVALLPVTVASVNDLATAFAEMTQHHCRALLVMSDVLFVGARQQLSHLSTQHRIATSYVNRLNVLAGGLMSYGPNTVDMFRRSAGYVDKILKGGSPADLPIEQPMRFELVINLKTAKALGLTIPPSLLARADEVIE
jgi:ABC-type uncharacterized transport system substrate-binding protein